MQRRPGLQHASALPAGVLETCQSLLASSAAHMPPAIVFGHASAIMVPIYFTMALAPNSKLSRTLATTPFIPLAMSAIYALLLAQACATTGFVQQLCGLVKATLAAPSCLPDVSLVAELFKDPAITSLAWMHLLLLDFYQARDVFVDGILRSVATGHSVILCFMFGPLGLLSHVLTRQLTPRSKAA